MENKVMKFYSKAGNNIILRAIPGHFATSHSHINYYVDMTGLKTRRSEACAVARAFVPVSYTHLDVYKRQGFTECILPQVCLDKMPRIEGIRLIGVRNVSDAANAW